MPDSETFCDVLALLCGVWYDEKNWFLLPDALVCPEIKFRFLALRIRRRGMKTIGIIGAMAEEIAHLKEKLHQVTTVKAAGLEYFHGSYGGNNIVLVVSGIGKVNAAVCTQAMIDRFDVNCVINTGVAGGLMDGLHIGDILISADAVQHDMDTSALGDPVATIPRLSESYFPADAGLIRLAQEAAAESDEEYQVVVGRVASGDQFIGTKAGKERIRSIVD